MMKNGLTIFLTALIAINLISCKQKRDSENSTKENLKEKKVNSHVSDGNSHDHSVIETFSIDKLVDEIKTVPDSIIKYLHAQHHNHKVLERRTVPPAYETKNLKNWKDYAEKIENLPVINPGPGEYVHVMEGYKNGYQNLVIGITETFPGGAPPMHTHEGEESHVLLEGDILYALGDTIFTISAPYIVNIPPMVPHAFKNIGDKTANLVVIFPTNVWKYDVLDYFPFKNYDSKGNKIK